MGTVYKENVREHPLARMERLSAGMDTDREECQWPNLTLLLLSLLGIAGYLVLIGLGGWIVWQVAHLAIRVYFH